MLFAIDIVLDLAKSLGSFHVVENMQSAVVPADHPRLHFWYFHRRPVGQVVSACRVCPGIGSTPLARQDSGVRDIGAGMAERGLDDVTAGLGKRGKGTIRVYGGAKI